MKDFNEIINNSKLTIKTKFLDLDNNIIQIRAYYNDPVSRKSYWCKFTSAQGWEHLCISGNNRKVPDWDVMCAVKDIFWQDEEVCVQFHPRKSEYVNNTENCLHIWRPLFIDLPEPDSLLVGLKGVSSEETQSLLGTFIHSLSPEETETFCKKQGINVNRQIRRGRK